MNKSVVTRIAYEVCFLLAIVSGAWSCADEISVMLLFVAAIVIAGWVAVGLKHGALRFLVSLVPAGVIFLADKPVLIGAMILAMLYFVLLMTIGNFDMEYLTVHFIFEVMAIFCLIFLFVFIAKAATTGTATDIGLLIFSLLFIVLGIITLRSLRLNMSMDAKNRLTNAAVVVLPALIGIAGSIGIYFIIKYAGPYIAYPFVLLVQWLYSLSHHGELPPPKRLYIDAGSQHLPQTHMSRESHKDLLTDPTQSEKITTVNLRIEDFPLRYVLAGAGIALLIVLIVWYVLRHRKAKAAGIDFEDTVSVGERLARRRTRVPDNNADKIRRIYRDYLFFLRLRGVEIDSGDTSREILDTSRDHITGEAGETLRQIYIRARYASADEISDEDVKLAEDCLARIKEENKK